jgi:hypothetical protein
MKTFNLFILALCAVLFTSCAGMPSVRVPGGTIVFGNNGGGQGGGGQYRQNGGRHLVDNGGTWGRTKWQNGDNRYTYVPGATVSVLNKALSQDQKTALADEIDAWAIGIVKSKKPAPNNDNATQKAIELNPGKKGKIRVKMANVFNEEFIPQERKFVSREKVREDQVPQDEVRDLRSKAEQNFYRHQKNEKVEGLKFYPASDSEDEEEFRTDLNHI